MELAFGPGATLLGKYRVESVVGRGGMGIVLRVTHLHLGEELAIFRARSRDGKEMRSPVVAAVPVEPVAVPVPVRSRTWR